MDGSRKALFGPTVKADHKAFFFSPGKVTELLSLASEDSVTVQTRSSGVLTVSYGTSVLELSQPCPPDCY